jgi:tetratricopeptide (TPR) repeat protein
LKPANLFITARDQAKILDFGLAKLRARMPQSDANGPSGTLECNILGATTISGTLGYMSPEQTRGEPLDSRTDLFALGVVLYEMLTGKAAFSQSSAADVHRAVFAGSPQPPSSLNNAVPSELDRIVLKALEKDRELRYQNAADLRADLKRLKRDSDSRGSGLVAPVLTPRPKDVKAASARHWWTALGFAALVLLAAAGTLLWYRSRQPTLNGNRDVVLADFVNTTGDPVFDAALREGLAAQLEQSPYLGVVSDRRISQAMKLMMQPKDARLTPALAREVCQRTSSAVSIEGSIAALGKQYVLGLKALECKSGNILAQVQETADSKEQVLKALGAAAGKLRSRLGESLPSQQKYDVPLENVTTGSVEALGAYSLGIKAMNGGDCSGAIPHFKRAISLDPDFAMAYGKLGNCTAGGTEGDEYTRKAYLLRDHVSDQEQFYLASHYEQNVTGDQDAARKILETWAQTYPHDYMPAPNLLKLYLTTGEYQKALPLAQQMVNDSPGTAVNNATQLATALMYLNRVDDAKAVLLNAEAQHIDGPVIHYFLYEIDFMQHDTAAMEKEVAFVSSKPGWSSLMLELEYYSAGFEGRFARARALSDQASDDSRRAGNVEDAASYLTEEALEEALGGNLAIAEKRARAGMALSSGKDVEPYAGIALALAGDDAEASRLANDLNKRFPKDTMVQVYIAIIRACSLLGNGKSPEAARRAVEALAGVSPYETGGNLYLIPVYIRGRAYLAAGQSANAAAEFQKMLDHSGVIRNFPTGALARLGLAEAEAQAGDKAKARFDYTAFLALWHDADPDLPLLKAAKASLQSLGN